VNDPLYATDVLRLAASATGAGTLDPCDARGTARNPVCGDRVGVTLKLDAGGRIEAMAHETHACVLAQASAAILGARLGGSDIRAVESLRNRVAAMLKGEALPAPPFADYGALKGAAAHRNRHACVLLPIDAVLDALQRKVAN
jgi:NifU-like protein involved in Fe-S cluster formation